MKIINLQNRKSLYLFNQIIAPDISRNKLIERQVSAIILNVIKKRDQALISYTRQFDKVDLKPSQIKVTVNEITRAYKEIDPTFLSTAKLAIRNIKEYHQQQVRNSKTYQRPDGTRLTQRMRPLQTVGIYVPGGAAPLASSLLMCAIPAQVAGVKKIIICTPPNKSKKINPYILVSADLAGIQEIYKAGGAQAIAAMAYGTKIIPQVDKIIGAGNSYVVEAKRQVYGMVDIDLLPGPSEILVIADNTGNPKWIAADLLSQAEHTGNERVFLVTTSKSLANRVQKELDIQVNKLNRKKEASKSLHHGGAIIITGNMDECIDVANRIAPEHLEIHTKNPRKIANKISFAGAIFIGPWTPEPIGDYIAGTNHILPTSGTARMFSGLNLDEFIKKTNIVEYTEKGFMKVAKATIRFAETEFLGAHAESVRVRLSLKKKNK